MGSRPPVVLSTRVFPARPQAHPRPLLAILWALESPECDRRKHVSRESGHGLSASERPVGPGDPHPPLTSGAVAAVRRAPLGGMPGGVRRPSPHARSSRPDPRRDGARRIPRLPSSGASPSRTSLRAAAVSLCRNWPRWRRFRAPHARPRRRRSSPYRLPPRLPPRRSPRKGPPGCGSPTSCPRSRRRLWACSMPFWT